MPCRCVISPDQDHLRMDVSGNWTQGNEADEAIQCWAKAADACREYGLTRVLAVFDVPGTMPASAGFEIASDPAAFGWEYHFKVALVYTHRERYESNLFGEMVALNRYYTVKAFENESSAKAWLLRS